MTTPAGAAGLAGVVLAAGLGTRLRPLTDLRPKALVPVGGVPLLDGALARLAPTAGTGPGAVAVNAHHHADQLVAAVGGRARVAVEQPEALGTAGALGALREWVDDRPVLVTNADAWMPRGPAALAELVRGWDGERCRLLCAPAASGRGDFTTASGAPVTYAGSCLLPAALVARLPATPAGLYEVLWRDQDAAGRLDLLVAGGGAGGGATRPVAVDCGTPRDYLRANLLASGGASVVGAGAVVLGTLERSVVWDGARVGPEEHLVDAVRAGTPEHPVTVEVGPSGAPMA